MVVSGSETRKTNGVKPTTALIVHKNIGVGKDCIAQTGKVVLYNAWQLDLS